MASDHKKAHRVYRINDVFMLNMFIYKRETEIAKLKAKLKQSIIKKATYKMKLVMNIDSTEINIIHTYLKQRTLD